MWCCRVSHRFLMVMLSGLKVFPRPLQENDAYFLSRTTLGRSSLACASNTNKPVASLVREWEYQWEWRVLLLLDPYCLKILNWFCLLMHHTFLWNFHWGFLYHPRERQIPSRLPSIARTESVETGPLCPSFCWKSKNVFLIIFPVLKYQWIHFNLATYRVLIGLSLVLFPEFILWCVNHHL